MKTVNLRLTGTDVNFDWAAKATGKPREILEHIYHGLTVIDGPIVWTNIPVKVAN